MLTRNRLIAAGVCLALCIAAFVGGRLSSPAPEVHETEKVVYRDRVVETVKTVTVAATAEVKRVVVYRDRVTKPDGTKIEHEEERDATDTKTSTAVATDDVRVESHEGTREVERTVTPMRPGWRVGALVGSQLRLDPLGLAPPVFGAIVERRLFGPFSVGVWGLSSGYGGLALTLEF